MRLQLLNIINLMSVDLTQNQESEPHKHIETVYEKFQKAHENMSNFKELLTKFSTNKKPQTTAHPKIEAFTIQEAQTKQHKKQATTLKKMTFEQGWEYSGQIFEDKFHGYGLLLFEGKCVYSGEFKNGKMNGKGLLYYNAVFDELVTQEFQWEKYEGQFKEGHVSGFGNLYLTNGLIAIGYWKNGKPKYYTKVDSLLIQS